MSLSKMYRPNAEFIYITTIKVANAALVGIVKGAIGFDSEHAVKKGTETSQSLPATNVDDPDWVDDGRDWTSVRICVVQIAIQGKVFIINVRKMRAFPSELRRILESTVIAKVGCGFANDGRYLSEDLAVNVKWFVEVGIMTKLAHPENYANEDSGPLGLDRCVMDHFGLELDKTSQKALQWDGTITPKHIEYAGLDAQASLAVFQEASEGWKTGAPAQVSVGRTPGLGV
ncbi:hypothetical protein B0H11DRAFT_2236181 [Mycena galericulata]|nr:hypothetical protein B0H11DRAFT_2236181 [Mycena galericulata]